MVMKRIIAAIGILAMAVLAPAAAGAESAALPQSTIDGIRATIVRSPQDGLSAANGLRSKLAGLPSSPTRDMDLATADWLRAAALMRTNRLREAIQVVDTTLPPLGKYSGNTKLRGELVLIRGSAESLLGNIQEALANYQLGYRLMDAAHDARGRALALQDIGIIYRDAGDYDTALRYYAQSADAYKADPALLLSTYNNRGNALTELGRARDAAQAYSSALAIARTMNSPLLETRILQNLARSQADAQDYAAADNTLGAAYALAKGPAASWRPALDGVAAMVALRRDQLDLAARLIDRTFAGASGAAATMPLRDFHRTAYDIFRARGDDAKALVHLEAFKKLDDARRALAASSNAALMSARFDFANQDVKIARLRADQITREGQIERGREQLRATILYGVLAAATIVSTLLLIGFVSIRRSRNQVRDANQTLSATNVALEKALAAKTEFLATTSHEIRTPLNGILGMTQVILADRTLPTPVRERVALVHGAGETMKALVDDILDVAKMETGEITLHPVDTDLLRLLGDARRIWADQAETKQIALAIDLDEAPRDIVIDDVRLRQIVFNLMANAIKFTDRGAVRLVAKAEPAENGAEQLAIRIEDSGIGIPSDQYEAIFESFRQIDGGTTRRHGGTGLGLSICRNLARAMGGDVSVSSQLGVGSTFVLRLPLLRVAAPTARPVAQVATSLKDADLLLIEGNPLSQGIMRAVLGGAVGGLHIVSDADAARAALAQSGIDHVVIDGATLGLDIPATTALASAAGAAGARTAVLWPNPDDTIAAALREGGADQIIAKPISAPDLLAALQKVYAGQMAGQDMAA